MQNSPNLDQYLDKELMVPLRGVPIFFKIIKEETRENVPKQQKTKTIKTKLPKKKEIPPKQQEEFSEETPTFAQEEEQEETKSGFVSKSEEFEEVVRVKYYFQFKIPEEVDKNWILQRLPLLKSEIAKLLNIDDPNFIKLSNPVKDMITFNIKTKQPDQLSKFLNSGTFKSQLQEIFKTTSENNINYIYQPY